MQTRFRLFLWLLCLVWLGRSTPAQATHILGGDLTYAFTGNASRPNEYKVTARLYQEDTQTSVELGDEITLAAATYGCNPTNGGFTARLTRVSIAQAKPLGCAGDFTYEIIVFEGTVQLPPGVWTLSINEENRSFGMRNIVNSDARGFHIEALLDNSTGLRNNSPKFTSFTLPYLCASQSHRYSFSAFDSDGDSLVYQSVQPQTLTNSQNPCALAIPYGAYAAGTFQDPATGQDVAYSAGTFSAANPLFSFRIQNGVALPYFDLNAATGELVAQPIVKLVGPYVVAVRVDEFRKLGSSWTRIGSVTRDVIYSVFVGSGNRNPGLSSLLVGSSPAPQAFDQPIRVAPGQTVVVTLNATDADAGQTVRLSSDVATVVPGASFQATGSGQGQLTWQVPATLAPGRYSCTVTLADNACPLNGTEVRTLTFLVSSATLATKAGQLLTLAAFPMPFHDRVQFQLSARKTQPVVISDELGREVARLSSRPDGLVIWQPDTALPAGLYFARSADGQQVARLLRTDAAR